MWCWAISCPEFYLFAVSSVLQCPQSYWGLPGSTKRTCLVWFLGCSTVSFVAVTFLMCAMPFFQVSSCTWWTDILTAQRFLIVSRHCKCGLRGFFSLSKFNLDEGWDKGCLAVHSVEAWSLQCCRWGKWQTSVRGRSETQISNISCGFSCQPVFNSNCWIILSIELFS